MDYSNLASSTDISQYFNMESLAYGAIVAGSIVGIVWVTPKIIRGRIEAIRQEEREKAEKSRKEVDRGLAREAFLTPEEHPNI